MHTYFFSLRSVIIASAISLSFIASASEFAEAQAIEAVVSNRRELYKSPPRAHSKLSAQMVDGR